MKPPLDWSLLQSFAAVASSGSLSAAARKLGGSQPTLSRHIAALEMQTETRLFERTPGGLDLTQDGAELYDYALRMANAAEDLRLAREGRAQSLAGTVRLTASAVMATYVLPDILTDLRRDEPEIDIELVASDRTENLLQREADIAVRMYRPTQIDVITRKITDLSSGAFATPGYLNARGTPETIKDLRSHDVVGYDRSDLIIKGFEAAGLKVGRGFFPFRSDNQAVCWQMVVAGYGIGFVLKVVGATEPAVVPILENADIPKLPVWLTAHRELKVSRRVRRVYDFLADRLERLETGSSE